MPDPARALVVDLDGTLCRTDTLWECFFAAWRRCWWLPFAVPLWLAQGRAVFKQRIADIALPDVSRLPWHPAVVAAMAQAQAMGRPVVLATAADQRVARVCAAQFPAISSVLASDGTRNLKGAHKANVLAEKFADTGFDYIGDSRADQPVWAAAQEKLSVSDVVPAGGRQLAPPEPTGVQTWARLLRVRHWVKNTLVFVAPLAAHQWNNAAMWQPVIAAFVAFCCVCSAIYVINDLFDLDADRAHPSKQHRPLAAGVLPLATAAAIAVFLALAGLAISATAGVGVAVVVALYVALNAAYTLWIKRQPVYDVFCLAGLYTLRIVAGAIAAGVPLSAWLAAFSVFAFLSLALLKRAADIDRLAPDERLPGRGYSGRDAAFVNAFGVSSAMAACLVLALYVAGDQVSALYGNPLWLWGMVAVVLLWLARMWRTAMSGAMDDDPVLFATRDIVSWGCAAATALCLALAI
ncbi:MAG: UbiA family prenyltransferase [Burkholderiales bacterium]|nr:UbiA family prenyltransferase [Burkholderiales bacterium]